jgi:mycothiol synthase
LALTTAIAIRGPDAPAIEGLTFRRLRSGEGRRADVAALAELATAANVFDRIPWAQSADSLAAELEHDPTSDPEVDLILAEVDGRLVGSAQTGRSMRGDEWVHYVAGSVHPDWRRRGLGRALLRANMARAREVAAGPRPGPAILRAHAEETEVGADALLRSEGFTPVRWFVLMVRQLSDPLPDSPLPAGLEVRPVRPEDHDVIHRAENEAFRDHWGHREATEEDLLATLAQPDLDASLWQVAWDGEEVAGVVQNWIWRSENERLGLRRGWLERVSVRRPWRRRGLARALIARSLVVFREAGLDDAMLGVDSDNPTGALGLYESLGFTRDQTNTAFHRPLDP